MNFGEFPNYNVSKLKNFEEKIDSYDYKNNPCKLQLNINDTFFFFGTNSLKLYSIKNSKCQLLNELKIEIDNENASIIDFNNYFYCLNDMTKILLLNKTNLEISKTISMDSNLGLVKITEKIISIFTAKDEILFVSNWNISNNGITWSMDKTKQLCKDRYFEQQPVVRSNNFILSIFKKEGKDKYGYTERRPIFSLFEIKLN